MSELLPFAKLSGSGNDFVCIDNHNGQLGPAFSQPRRLAHLAKVLCRRGLGIGADGLIIAQAPEIEGVADIAASFLEPDGSQAELCGNGVACFTRWVLEERLAAGPEVRILTGAGVVRGKNGEGTGYMRACIPIPESVQTDRTIRTGRRRWTYDFAVTGVPHLVTYVEDLEKLEVSHWGPLLRHHEQFGPRGVNANFVQVLGEGRLAVRTYEFGVEGETLSCGTGSATAAILAARRFGWPAPYLRGDRPVLVQARSGDVLRIFFSLAGDRIEDVCLETLVRYLYHGRLHTDLQGRILDVQQSPARA
jgi:diaminopimelate epimerase